MTLSDDYNSAANIYKRWEAADPRDRHRAANGRAPPFKTIPGEQVEKFPPTNPQTTDKTDEKKLPELKVIDPAHWEGRAVPPQEWIVRELIPAKTVTLLLGDGGAGKSTIGMQLAVARDIGRDWLGMVPEAGRTLVLSAEDDEDELHRRTENCRVHYGISYSDLTATRFVDLVGENAVLGELHRNCIIRATPLFEAVEALVKEFRPDLVTIDALADAFAGDENNRPQVRQFIGLLKKLCRDYDLAVICIAHPSLSGMASGSGTSGSTGWSNSVRSRLYFERVKDSDGNVEAGLCQLTLKKANYAQEGQSFLVRWKAGVYVPEAGISSLDKASLERRAQDVFLRLLTKVSDQNQHVSPYKSSAYAPAKFAKMDEATGIKKVHLEKAMQKLLDDKLIHIEVSGPLSKQRSYLRLGPG
jgi:RecA-family ATPase